MRWLVVAILACATAQVAEATQCTTAVDCPAGWTCEALPCGTNDDCSGGWICAPRPCNTNGDCDGGWLCVTPTATPTATPTETPTNTPTPTPTQTPTPTPDTRLGCCVCSAECGSGFRCTYSNAAWKCAADQLCGPSQPGCVVHFAATGYTPCDESGCGGYPHTVTPTATASPDPTSTPTITPTPTVTP